MNTTIKTTFFTAIMALTLMSHPAFANKDTFERVNLDYGISLDVPSHWRVLTIVERKNIAAMGQAVVDNAGIEGADDKKETILAISAVPEPTGAVIRVSVTVPPPFTQADLAATPASDLDDIGAEFFKIFKQAEAAGGASVLEMQPLRIESISDQSALVVPYIRAGVNGPSPWQVTQYKIPVANYFIEITLSCRQSDAILWKPILERVKRSIQL